MLNSTSLWHLCLEGVLGVPNVRSLGPPTGSNSHWSFCCSVWGGKTTRLGFFVYYKPTVWVCLLPRWDSSHRACGQVRLKSHQRLNTGSGFFQWLNWEPTHPSLFFRVGEFAFNRDSDSVLRTKDLDLRCGTKDSNLGLGSESKACQHPWCKHYRFVVHPKQRITSTDVRKKSDQS